MIDSSKRLEYLHLFKALQNRQVKHPTPLILKMFGTLNKLHLELENRYILCNFLDQNSDIIGLQEDIYFTNNKKSLNQLFLLAFNKAKQYNMVNTLYTEYLETIQTIREKELLNLD